MVFELLLNFDGNCIGKHSLSCSKLHIHKFRSNQLVFKGFLCDKLSLQMVVGDILQTFLFIAFYKVKPFFFFNMFAVEVNYLLHYFMHCDVRNLDEVGHLDGMLFHLLFSFIYVF